MNVLILVDIQNDFVPGGALAVPNGDDIVPVVNPIQPCFDLVVATQDWHPSDHGSFAANHPGHLPGEVIELNGLPQSLWPTHCVQGTTGAEFVPGFERDRWDRIFVKGIGRKASNSPSPKTQRKFVTLRGKLHRTKPRWMMRGINLIW